VRNRERHLGERDVSERNLGEKDPNEQEPVEPDLSEPGFSKQEPGDKKQMADPFQVRVRFSAQLQNLNASVTSAQKAAQYALKYKDMDEDLHSCILEQLEKVSGLPAADAHEEPTAEFLQAPDGGQHESQHHVLHRALP